MLIEKELGNQDQRLKMLVRQYEALNCQLIMHVDTEENARVALDKKMLAGQLALKNHRTVNISEYEMAARAKHEPLGFARKTEMVLSQPTPQRVEYE